MYYYKDAIIYLISKFPELKPIYDKDIDEYIDLPYLFYEPVFVPYIMDKINLREEEELKKIFSFIEDLLKNGDEKTINLIEVAVIESLFFEKEYNEIKPIIFKFCGKLTKESFDVMG